MLVVTAGSALRGSGVMLALALSLAACGSSRASPEPSAWPGTPVARADLPAATTVPDHARLLVPAIANGSSLSERALLTVPRRPRQTWARLLRQLNRRYPHRYIESSDCGIEDERGAPVRGGVALDGTVVLACSVTLTGRQRNGTYEHFSASLRRVPDDVSGGYLLELSARRARHYLNRDGPSDTLRPRWPSRFPSGSRRRPPRVGELLSPSRERERYTLLPGSELVAVHGTGTITGGFNAVLRVLPGHNPVKIGEAYARQAAQSDAPTTERRHGNSISITPPGEPGGYSAAVTVLDQPGADRDLIIYDLRND